MSSRFGNPLLSRQLADCFYLQIPLQGCKEEINQLVHEAYLVEQSVDMVVNGSSSFEDLLEAIEGYIPNMDRYVDEIETNLNETLIVYQSIPYI